ncbi:MAG: transcriptional regulator [Anaerolineaceae bacterium]|nr:transcriptional regulator [Anaerolineaceae bacterium]
MMSKTANFPEQLSPIDDIDKLIHEPARLKILSVLSIVESCDFIFLMRQTNLTWGNLSAHLKKLDAANYIEIKKEFIDNKPKTLVFLTPPGREAFDDYRQKMRSFFTQFE